MREGASANANLALALLCTASFVSTFNMLVMVPILPEVVDDFGVSIAIGGLLSTAFALVAGVGSILVGPSIDRIGRHPIIIAGLLVFGASGVLSAIAPNFWILIIARALAGVGSAGLFAAVMAAVGDYYPYNQRGKALALLFTVSTAASVIALPISAVLADLLSWRINFAAIAVLSFAAAIMLWLLAPDVQVRKRKQGALRRPSTPCYASVVQPWRWWPITLAISIGVSSLPSLRPIFMMSTACLVPWGAFRY